MKISSAIEYFIDDAAIMWRWEMESNAQPNRFVLQILPLYCPALCYCFLSCAIKSPVFFFFKALSKRDRADDHRRSISAENSQKSRIFCRCFPRKQTNKQKKPHSFSLLKFPQKANSGPQKHECSTNKCKIPKTGTKVLNYKWKSPL